MSSARPSAEPIDAVVTGMGVVSALGTGCDAHWEAISAGRHGLRPVERFDTAGFASTLAGLWPGWDGRRQADPGPDLDLERTAADFPVAELALVAAREAWQRAALTTAIETGRYRRGRIALIFGTCFGQGFRRFHELSEQVAAALGILGPCVTISTACASSTNAVGLGRDLLRGDRADVVLAGGADVLLREVFAGFSSLGVLSPAHCAPFSEPTGTTLGEGAGFLVLEREDRAERRGAQTRARICGYGLSADAFHETTPDPAGAGIARALRGALGDAGWRGADVDYVNAHATGTLTNDRTEWSAIRRELGERSAQVAVSGTKSFCGHAQGAAGVVELIASLLAAEHGQLVPTLHFRGARPGCPEDPVASATPRAQRVERALKISAAFGGANAVVAFAAARAQPVAAAASSSLRTVLVRGAGVVCPLGVLSPSELQLDAERKVVGRVPELDLRRVDPTINPRRLDRSGQYLTAAAALCLGEQRLTLRGAARERAGLFIGATRMPKQSTDRCKQSIERGGVTAASASAFARMSVNAPAGACAMTLGLKGPSTTVSVGEGSGLLAIALAAQWLATRGDADCIVAGAVDELASTGGDATEGAACALLEAASAASERAQHAAEVTIAGWGVSGHADPRAAVAQALGEQPEVDGVVSDGDAGRACLAPAVPDAAALPLGFVDVSRLWGRAEASRSALAFLLAFERLRRGAAGRSLLVTAVESRSASVAVLLRRAEVG